MEHSPESVQFYLTAESECPYLEGKQERKLFTHLSGKRAPTTHYLLSEHGFRRSQNLVYKPTCLDCSACHSVRIVAEEFAPSKRHKRVLSKNADIVSTQVEAQITTEQYDLFHDYLVARHTDGGMADMDLNDFEDMVEDTAVDTVLIEYRLKSDPDLPLVGVALTDVMPDGLSMVYSFFHPSLANRGLGNFMILDHIKRTVAMGLDHVYLGFWVKQSPKMAYKASFQPLQIQMDGVGWCAWHEDI